MKRIFLLPVILLSLSLPSCFLFRGPPPDPTTNASYFQEKLTKLATDLSKNATRHPRKVAVMDFVNPSGKTSQLGKYLTAKFTEISVMKSLFQTPAEGEVTKAAKQMGISYNGTMDSAAAKRLGEAIGADAIIVGTISDLQKGSDVDLVVKIIDAKNGNVISASSTSFLRSKQVSTMLESF